MNTISKQLLASFSLAVTVVLPSFAQEAHVVNLTGHAAGERSCTVATAWDVMGRSATVTEKRAVD